MFEECTDVEGNTYGVRTVDSVVEYFTEQEKLAKAQYLQRKQLRESLECKVASVDPAVQEERDQLINQVLLDLEETSTQKIAAAWTQEKHYNAAFDILRQGLGQGGVSEPQPTPNYREKLQDPRQPRWSPRDHMGNGKRTTITATTKMPNKTGTASARPQRSSSAAPTRTRRGPRASNRGHGIMESKGGAQRRRPASASTSSSSNLRRKQPGAGSLALNVVGQGRNTASAGNPQKKVDASGGVSASAEAAKGKPWRSSMSLKKIKRIEKKHKKKGGTQARLARATRKVKKSGATTTNLQPHQNRSRKSKMVPKLGHYPTYGPQNTAARALRKHQGRELNMDSSHQFALSRAKQHMQKRAAAEAARKQEKEIQDKLMKERLEALNTRAKSSVAGFARAPAAGTTPVSTAGMNHVRPTSASATRLSLPRNA